MYTPIERRDRMYRQFREIIDSNPKKLADMLKKTVIEEQKNNSANEPEN